MKPGLSGYQDQKNILQEEKTRDEYYKETKFLNKILESQNKQYVNNSKL